MIQIYCLDVNTNCPNIVLPRAILKHINKYKEAKLNKTSKLAWSFLFKLLKEKHNCNLNNEIVCFNKNGKPYLKSKKLFFNLSHSCNLIAIGISDKDIGIDIQQLIKKNICDSVAKKVLNKEEFNKYKISRAKRIYFTKLWTKKEALIKLKGESILNTAFLRWKRQKIVKTVKIKDFKLNVYFLSFTI